MENTLFIQIILLIIVLSLSFYLLFPLIMEIRREQKRPQNSGRTVDSQDVEESKPQLSSPPVVSYSDKANALKEKEKRTEELVNHENLQMAKNSPMPKYEDDPSSIDLKELAALRNAIRNMTRELSNVRRTNSDLKKMINDLQRNHTDAISRVSNTDLWEQEQQKWSKEFVVAYQDYTKQES